MGPMALSWGSMKHVDSFSNKEVIGTSGTYGLKKMAWILQIC